MKETEKKNTKPRRWNDFLSSQTRRVNSQKNPGKDKAHYTRFKVIEQILVMATAQFQKKVNWPTSQVEDSDRNSHIHAAIDKVLLTKMRVREKTHSSTNGAEKIVIPHIKGCNQIINCHPF